MLRSLLVLFILISFAESDSECPPNVVCTSTLNRHSCPKNTYFREKRKSQNCCPACVTLKDLDEPCETNEECGPGLFCSELTNPPTPSKLCKYDVLQKCDHYKHTDSNWTTTKYWNPDCLPNGKYAPKQCKGEKLAGKCFCTNEDGVRIFGESPWIDAENMTCSCSHQAERLGKKQKDMSLHCDEYGNYENLQCNDGICWCANERTGIPYTPVVPESMTRILPCFEESNFGSQYLRQCDSSRVHTERTIKILKNHGLRNIILPKVNCNYDGSFARVQSQGFKKYCVYKNKYALCNPDLSVTDCNCYYDRFVAETISGKEFNFECKPGGSYLEKQSVGDTEFYVDSDGFKYPVRTEGN